ncbi:MAG: GAF domain-containing protein [Chloroflexi bacterium]|nr:GAF domain-containing protein [Chloroflexota bacterium]
MSRTGRLPRAIDWRFWQTLRARLMGLLGIIFLVTVLVVTLGVSAFVSRTEDEAWRDRQGEAANNAAIRVALFLDGIADTMRTLGIIKRSDLEDDPQIAQRLLTRDSGLLELIRIDTSGQVYAGAYRDEPLLANLYTIRQSNWFRLARAGEPYIGDVQISSLNEPYLILALPLPEHEIVAARVRMQLLWDIVAHLTFGDTGSAYVVNRDGLIIAHTRPRFVLAHTTIQARPEFTAIMQTRNHAWSGQYTNLEGAAVFAVSAPVVGSDWIIITELSQVEAKAASWTALLTLGGGMLLFALGVILIGRRYLEWGVFRPIEALRDGAELIGRGHFDHRITVMRRDEIGQVAEAFNEMARRVREGNQQLQHAKDELEHKVAERTTEARASVERLTIFNEISRSVSTTRRLDDVLDTIHARVRRLMPLDVFVVGLFSSDGREMSFPATYDSGVRYEGTRAPLAQMPLMARVQASGKPLLINLSPDDMAQLPPHSFGDPTRHSAALVTVPLVAESGIIGVMSVQSYTAGVYTAAHIEWLEGVANQTAIAIESARLFDALAAELAARQLAAAERETLIEKLEERNTELERFTYTVSHDLKSPLITMRGFLGYVEQDARAGQWDRLQQDMQRITDATGKMQRLLDELLELSRIGRKMNAPEDVPFEMVAREAVGLAGGRLEARGVTVVIAPGLPAVYGDHVRLVEVVQNLVDNAAKFMGDQPAPRVEIGVRTGSAGGPVFYVKDNGIGIEPQYHARVFGLFDKLDAHSEGTGVGLALVKRIVEVHGGRIWVESEGQGRGATFCFTLATPAAAAQA